MHASQQSRPAGSASRGQALCSVFKPRAVSIFLAAGCQVADSFDRFSARRTRFACAVRAVESESRAEFRERGSCPATASPCGHVTARPRRSKPDPSAAFSTSAEHRDIQKTFQEPLICRTTYRHITHPQQTARHSPPRAVQQLALG